MNELIEILNKKSVEYQIGIINYDRFHSLPEPFDDRKDIKFKWTKDSLEKLFSDLKKKNIYLNKLSETKYNALFKIKGTEDKILIEYAINSHVQIPKTILKHFKTDDYMYYLKTDSNEIKRVAPKKYNTQFGYYSLYFEEHLNNNYENMISEIINTIIPFVNRKVQTIHIQNLKDKINKLFLMSLFRNPKYVGEVNRNSMYAQLIDGGYDSEYIAYTSENINCAFFKKYSPILTVNTTNKGIVTIKTLFSDLKLKNNINSFIIALHPKFALTLVPNDYYNNIIKEKGEGSYLKLSDEKELLELNKQIYYCAKNNKTDIIGLKSDLEELISATVEN